MNPKKNIALLSNYAWAYSSSRIARKYFPKDDITLFTTNSEDVARRHDFGMKAFVTDSFAPRRLFSIRRKISPFRKTPFEAAIIDYSFNFNTVWCLAFLKFRKLLIIDPDKEEAFHPISRLLFLKIFAGKLPYFMNKALIKLSTKLRIGAGLGLPSEISIETSTSCNLKCKGCPTGLDQLNRPPGAMSGELFKNIVENNRRDFRYFDLIFPFLYGEPLLNKNIIKHLKKLRGASRKYTRIELHTNGNFKNSRPAARELLATGVDLISISIDGTDKASYESFRTGGDFDLVCEFTRNLTAAREEMDLSRPEIVIQMILTKYSEDKMEDFKKLKTELGADRYLFKSFFHEFTHLSEKEASLVAPSKKELVLTREKKEEMIKRKNNLCGWPYRSLTIMRNGSLAPCCVDSNAALVAGLNISDSTVRKVWNSPKYKKFRRDMLRGKIKMCNRCFCS